MAITWTSSTAEGTWLGASGASWWQAVTFGPAGFEAYVRVRYIPDPVRPGQHESDHELPDDHPRDLDQARRALALLAPFTGTPDDCWFAVWEGYSGSLELPAGLPLLELPNRRYGLLRGDLADLVRWKEVVASDLEVAPAFVWPSDHSWCFASDVDPHWAGIGASGAAVETLLTDPGLDVVRADPTGSAPSYY